MTNRKIGRGEGYGSGSMPRPRGFKPGGQDLYVQKHTRTDAEYAMEKSDSDLHDPPED